MQRTVRTFVAVEISHEVRSRAARLIAQLEPLADKVRWVRPEHLHLTLKFLGDVDLREVPQVCDTIAAAIADLPPFLLRIAGAGAFPTLAKPRTVWLGADEGVSEMQGLHDRIDAALSELGFRQEHRRFRPHLTIGRVRGEGGAGISALAEALAQQQDFVAGMVDVGEVVTFSSELDRSGPTYEALATAELTGD